MFSHKYASALATAIFAASLAASVYLGAVKHPPGVRDQYGAMHRYSPKFTSLCAYDRTVSLAGEGYNMHNGLRCKNEFERTGTLDQFNYRYWLIGGSAIGLLASLFGSARHGGSIALRPRLSEGDPIFAGAMLAVNSTRQVVMTARRVALQWSFRRASRSHGTVRTATS